jgi:hypothetical protein
VSSGFMFAIAVMYGCAAISFYIEGKYLWFVVAVCWGIGNALLGLMSAGSVK